jgi:hypothetical protein
MSKKIESIAFESVKTQREAVLWHLKMCGSLTSWQAIKDYGITRLASIIHGLRAEGYNITSIDVEFKNRFGGLSKFAEYRYSDPVEIKVDKDNQTQMF